MRKAALLGIVAGTIGVMIIVVAVIIVTLRSQSQVYTSEGLVDLSHLPPTAIPPTVGGSPAAAAVTGPTPELGAPNFVTPLVSPATSQVVAGLPPTLAPTVTPQPTLQPASTIFYDDFADRSSGWTPLFLDKNSDFNGYSMGGYYFDFSRPDALVYDVENRWQMSAGRYALDIRYENGSGEFGLLLGVQGDLNRFETLSYTSIGLTEQGAIVARRHTPENEQSIAEAPPNPALSAGQQPLHLAVDSTNAGISVLVNDNVVLRAPNAQIQNGYVGLFARSYDRPLHISFDNLLALAQQPAEQPACASVRSLFAAGAGQPLVEGDDVLLLRRRLAHLGYAAGQENGPFDQSLAAAVAQFQMRNELSPNGRMEGLGWCRLLSDSVIRADSGRAEQAEEQQVARQVEFNTAALTSVLAVSIRQADETWRAALALPGKSELRYLDLGGDALDPTWSPDARTLAFTSNRSGSGAVWLLDLQSGALRQLTPNDQECQFPAWSPDSRMLVVTCEPLDNASLAARDFVIDIASGQRRKLSDEHAGWADCSATNEIVFTHWTGKSFDLVRVNPDGSGATNLSNTDDIDEDIAGWSPDGSQIVFVANPRAKSEQRQIYVMRSDGSGIAPVTAMPGPNSDPVWSPDGQEIVFSNQNGARLQPWMLRAGDLQPQQLSANEDRIWFMDWVRSEP